MINGAEKRALRSADEKRSNTPLRELAALFLKLGTIAFGGPAAHIAMMEDEVVRRHRWMTHDEFLDLLGATNLIPGPNSTEMAIHIGHRRAGWKGLVVAGASFILPAVLIVTGFASAYVQYGSIPEVKGVLYGVKPVIIAIVVQALWSLGRAAIKTKFLAVIGIAGIILTFLGLHELLVLLGAGLAVATIRLTMRSIKGQKSFLWLISGSILILSSCRSEDTTSSRFLIATNYLKGASDFNC
jgi:chromate transporter